MATTLQFRRGTTSELATQAGAAAELFVDTTKDTVVVMDGSTQGGFPLAKESDLQGLLDSATLNNPTFTGTITLANGEPTVITDDNFTFLRMSDNSPAGYHIALGDTGGTFGLTEGQTVTLNFNSGNPITVTLVLVTYDVDPVDFFGDFGELRFAWGYTAIPPSGSELVSIEIAGEQTSLVGVTKDMVGLGNVTNESKATMFNNPTFTGTVTGVTATIPNGATINTPLINGGVLNSSGTTGLILQGNVLTQASTITITAGENGGGYFSYNPFYDAIMLVIQPQEGKPLLAIQTLQPGDLVSITLDGTPTEYQVELIVDTGNSFSNEHFIKFFDDTGLPEFSGFEAITLPSRPGVFGSQEFIIDSTLTTRRASEFISVQSDLFGQYDYLKSAVWYINAANSGMSGDFSVPITSVPFNNNRVAVMTLIVAQGATGYIPSSVSVNGFTSTVQWLGGVAPTGTANATDVFSFSLLIINNANEWTILGSVSSYKSVA
jgi:hypothetical protein